MHATAAATLLVLFARLHTRIPPGRSALAGVVRAGRQRERAPEVGGGRVGPPPGPAYWLSGAAAVTAAAASAMTFFVDGILTGPAAMNGSARGTALVVLVVAVPALLLSMWRTAGGSARALVTWLGATAYLLYNAVMFVFATPFNQLFLLYVAMLSLSLWALVGVLARTDERGWAARVSARLPVRSIAGYTAAVVVLNVLAWLRTIVPASFSSDPTSFLEGTGMTTNPVFVLDLAVWLPALGVAAVWLWRRRPWGALVVGAGLAYSLVESHGIAVDQWFGSAADPSSAVVSAGLVPAFAVVALLGLVPLSVLLGNVDRTVDRRSPQVIPVRAQ